MFFSVTREGRPLRKRRYLFSEAFAVIALAAYGAAAGDRRSTGAGAGSVPADAEVPPRAGPARAEDDPRHAPDERPRDADDPDRDRPGAAQGRRRSALRRGHRRVHSRDRARLPQAGPPACSRPSGRTASSTTRSKAAGLSRSRDRGGVVHSRGSAASRAARPRRADRARHDDHRLVAGHRLGRRARRPRVLQRRARSAEHRVPPRHEALVAAQRSDHRHAPRAISSPATSEYAQWHAARARLGLRALSRSGPRRMVRLPASRRHRLDAAERQHVEGPVPPAAHAVVLLPADRGDARQAAP